jgi:DNA-binding NtrC family response regulator
MAQPILIVEDDKTQAQMLAGLLRRKMGFGSILAEHGREALDLLERDENIKSIKLVILDVSMPVMGGIETLEILRERYPDLPVIMLTGSNDVDDAAKAMRLGAIDFVVKPYEIERMAVTVKNALKLSVLTKEVTLLKKHQEGTLLFKDLIGHDMGLREVVSLGRKAAGADIAVLIGGETGTGKEVFARAIHGESARAGKPFVAVNCGAIPSQLVESTLFGHEKGSFTGATQKVIGKFREAEGGTIFLDEVGELPLEAQVALLRVLQQKEVEPVGAGKPTRINVRIVSATNRDLAAEVEGGRFREDLYYRLNVLSIDLPPLRARPKDIIPLAHHFTNKYCLGEGGIPRPMSAALEEYLESHEWRGNVRELENVINRAMVVCNDSVLCIKDALRHPEKILPESVLGKTSKTRHQLEMESQQIQVVLNSNKIKTMDEIEAEAIEIVLQYHKHNVTKSAQSLGMAKSTFYKKLKKYFPYFWDEGIRR